MNYRGSLFKPIKKCEANILIVDDCFDSIELLEFILIERQYNISSTNRGISAIEEAKNNTPDLILLDICMPGLNGFEVCQLLKDDYRTQNIPIIFLSCLSEIDTKAQAFDLGGDDYITKPFLVREVLIRIENQLKKYQRQSELKAKNTFLEFRNQQLNRLVSIDNITQLNSRYCYEQFLQWQWKMGIREQFSLSLIIADIDYFQLYNQLFGYLQGDACLRNIALAICKTVSHPNNLVARYSNKKLAIVLPQTNAWNALSLAEEVRLAVKSLKIIHHTPLATDFVSLSLGIVSIIPSRKYSIEQFVTAAERALNCAKKQGCDRSVMINAVNF